MVIRKGDVCIRNAAEADCETLAKWWNDGSVMAHAGFPAGLGTTAYEIQSSIANDTDNTRRRLIIEYKATPVGEMNYTVKNNSAAEIGIKICDASYQNKGLGKVVLSLLIKELFSAGYTKIILDTNLKNDRAQHVYETLGFRKLKVNINSWKDQTGALQSSVDYELTPENFIDMSNAKIAVQ